MSQVWYKKFCVLLLTLATVLFLSPNLFAREGEIFAPGVPGVITGFPPQVIMTGTFAPPKGTVKPGMDTLTVSIDKAQRTFIVKNVSSLNSDATGPEILDLLFPPRLVFWGNKNLLTTLAKPQLEGKVLQLQGTLYVSDGIFFVTSEKVVPS